jgi:hypothetical protein
MPKVGLVVEIETLKDVLSIHSRSFHDSFRCGCTVLDCVKGDFYRKCHTFFMLFVMDGGGGIAMRSFVSCTNIRRMLR